MTHKCSEGAKCTCRTEVQSHNCMYRLRSPEEAVQDYMENLAPPSEFVTPVTPQETVRWMPTTHEHVPAFGQEFRGQYEKLPVIVDGEPQPVGRFKAVPTERLDAIRQNHVDRVRAIGIETTGKAYHEIVGELLDYIEGVRAILNHGHQ